MKTNVWIIVNFLLCLNTPKLGIRQLFLKPLESWPSIVVGDGEWWWLWSLLVVHYTFRGTLLPQHFPLKNMGKPLPPFSIGKALGTGLSIREFFLKNLTMLAAIATRSFGVGCIRHIFGRMKATMTTWPKPETAHETLCHPGQDYVRVGTIPYFSFISGISCQYWEGVWLPWRYWWCG